MLSEKKIKTSADVQRVWTVRFSKMNFLNIYSTAKFITLNLKSTFPLAPFLIFHAPTSEERMWAFAEGHKPGAEQHPFLESFPLGPEWDTSAVRSRVHRAMGFLMATTVDWGQLPGWSWGRVLNWGFQLLTKALGGKCSGLSQQISWAWKFRYI